MMWLQWLIPWEASASILFVTILTASLFVRGCRKIKQSLPQKIAFGVGLLSMYAVTQTQADYFAEHEFFVHQLQNAVLHHIGPFLIVLAGPKDTLFAGLPITGKRLIVGLSHWLPAQALVKLLFHPVAAVLMFAGLIVFWLLPSVHFIAMLDWRLYRLMNWSMALNGLMFWGAVLNSKAGRSAGCRIAMMLAVIPPQILIGAIIFFTVRELYPIYTLCGRAFAGISSIADQQIGGLILWTQGAMMGIAGILIVIQQELRQSPSAVDTRLPVEKRPGL
ncbi:cytochrome c oxidase assembly protein [Methylomicrobium sp. Wu6]|uniref:cytochrome c oxidase assembly protein n=1 Tax=Methylomicrobium sp. Wu6 TaxID=3107928 RepID=UPI002DD69F47|nr:cytochrome c oxidase assembly protein [Methylomicrobium sp. Wu6]MEC4748891.1 cytochrome c oxidase assembly protein [Methylomicrobium sp. Wu6]